MGEFLGDVVEIGAGRAWGETNSGVPGGCPGAGTCARVVDADSVVVDQDGQAIDVVGGREAGDAVDRANGPGRPQRSPAVHDAGRGRQGGLEPSPITSVFPSPTGHSLMARPPDHLPNMRRSIFCASGVKAMRWMPAGSLLTRSRNRAIRHGCRVPSPNGQSE